MRIQSRTHPQIGLRWLLTLLVLALVAAACGGGDDGEAADDDGGATVDAGDGATPDEGTPAEGSATFVYAMAGVPDTLDIVPTYQGDATRRTMYELGSRLVAYDPGAEGCERLATVDDLSGDLAESWERDDEGNVIFHLREGVMSTEGNELTAEDVKWSLDRAKELSPIVRFLFFDVAEFEEENTFEVVDERTFKVNVAEQTALDVAVFTWGQHVVYDRAAVQDNAGDDPAAVSEYLTANAPNFGPWQLEGFQPGTEIALTANPNYWNAGNRGNVERLVLRNVAEPSTRLQLLQAGEIDLAGQLSFEQYQSLQDSGGAQVLACSSPNRDMLMLNTRVEAFADPQVRGAISMAIDRQVLADAVYRGFAEPSTSGLSQTAYEYPDPSNAFTFDPDQARQLLEEAGYGDGLSATLTISPTRPGAHAEAVAIQLQDMAGEIGVEFNIDLVAGAAEFSDQFFEGAYEAILYNEPPAIADPFYSLNLYNTTASFQNTHGFDNARYDELTAEIRRLPPGDERAPLMQEVAELIVETTPVVYLVERQYVYAWSDDVDLSTYHHAPHGEIRVVNLQVQPD